MRLLIEIIGALVLILIVAGPVIFYLRHRALIKDCRKAGAELDESLFKYRLNGPASEN
jgi:hypothetical protein